MTKTSKETEAKITWLQMTPVAGTTARVPLEQKARSGSYITHDVHGKVKLVRMSATGKLLIELLGSGAQVEVAADECGPPFFASVKLGPDIPQAQPAPGPSLSSSHRFLAAILSAAGFPASTGQSQGSSSKAAGKQPYVSTQPKRRGRPPGKQDTRQRKLRGTPGIAWEYTGKNAGVGTQFAKLGEAVEHDGMGTLTVVQQLNATSLTCQSGEGSDGFLVTVEAAMVRAAVNASPSAHQAGSTSTSNAGKKYAFKSRGKRAVRVLPSGTPQFVTKGTAAVIRKRKKREATAIARGKPIKPARVTKNFTWPTALKDQAVQLYLSTYAVGSQYAACAKALQRLPGFSLVTS